MPGEIPDGIRYLLDNVDIVEAPDEGNPVIKETYARMHNWQCMLCGAQLGEESMIAMNQYGIFLMACGGACFTDLPVLHWIQEQHEDINKAVEFRGGAVNPDEPEEENDHRT